MAANDRPSGLTTLAVVNFVFAGFDVLGGLGVFATAVAANLDEVWRNLEPKVEILRADYIRLLVLTGAWALVESALLAVLGVGLLRQSRRWGFFFGNAYGALGIAGTVALTVTLPAELVAEERALQTLTGIFYPAFMLLLVNLVFRRDLAR